MLVGHVLKICMQSTNDVLVEVMWVRPGGLSANFQSKFWIFCNLLNSNSVSDSNKEIQ